MKQPRLTFRLRPDEMLTLEELRDKLEVSCSALVRTIIYDFLTRNEEVIERILTEDADHQEIAQETKRLFEEADR